MWPQTLQGADILSALTGALVLVPDFFEGSPAELDWMPTDTDEKKKLVGEFFEAKAGFEKNVSALMRVRKALSDRYPAVDDHVGVFGLCWGGKSNSISPCRLCRPLDLANHLSFYSRRPGIWRRQQGARPAIHRQWHGTSWVRPFLHLDNPVSVSRIFLKKNIAIPANAQNRRLDIKDGEALTAPHIILASKDESAEAVEEHKTLLSQPGKIGEVETYSSMHHGWMGARADLADADNVKEYTRGYDQVSAFFSKHI